MRQMLVKIFTDEGFIVVGEAVDGTDALAMFDSLKPDLVTLDIVMPKMRGIEVLERLMAVAPEARDMMASSVSDARTVMHCLKMGAKQYIVKPYDEAKILAAVKKALEL
jgi:two-component system chemotaxis response regulator CheY